MWIEETFCLIPEGVFLLATVCGNFFDTRRIVDACSVDENRNHHFTNRIGAAFELCLFPGLDRVEKEKILGSIDGLIGKTDQVSFDLAVFFLINTENRFISRVGNFLGIFRKLDLRYKFTVLILNGGKLVYATEGRSVFGGDQIGSDTPRIDGRTLNLEIVDQIFIQIVGCTDRCFRMTGFI